jgi:hypothetical protein
MVLRSEFWVERKAAPDAIALSSFAGGHTVIARLSPEDGDVIVREEWQDGALVYVLCTAPGSDQYLVRTRDEALAHALTFAQRQRVRAWLTATESQFTQIQG